MPNAKPLIVDIVEQDPLVFVRMDGIIDEDNRLQERMANVSAHKILINMAKVERINSCGVRDWVRWVKALEGRNNSIHLVQCSPTVVAQVNMVRNFCGDAGHVVSFQAPYYCQPCAAEKHETLMTQGFVAQAEPPVVVCESCGEAMEFDDLPDSYFAFVRDHSAKAAVPEVQSSIGKFDDAQMLSKMAALRELSSGNRTPGSSASSAPGSRPGTGPNEPSRFAKPDSSASKPGGKV